MWVLLCWISAPAHKVSATWIDFTLAVRKGRQFYFCGRLV
jgi:hypothetical protein